MQKPAQTSQPIAPLLANRWSPCAFDPQKPVSAAAVDALCEAARWAPSCYGAQPWRFVVCNKAENETAWERALACLAPPNQEWAKNAPVLVVVCAATRFERNGKPNAHHAYDAGAAAFAMVLQAEALGLRAHQMGGFSADVARAAFAVPAGFVCLAMLAAGWQAPASALPTPQLQAREAAARERLPLAAVCHKNQWNG